MNLNMDAILEVLEPVEQWAYRCHEASLYLVRSGVLGDECRVARGACKGVGGQHSWVVVGMDCYDEDAVIVDPTLWSYDKAVRGIWTGTARNGRHVPHGKGSIWEWGRPDTPTGPEVKLTPREPLSDEAQAFLGLLGPLDRKGWAVLAHAPVEDWPSAEIIAAMHDTEGIGPLVPVDIVGMLTDRESRLYLPAKYDAVEEAEAA
jgi:hypothetical protein